MSRAKHWRGSWRVMKEWCKERERVSKLCYRCAKKCKHKSLGELTYCWQMEPKDEKDLDK